MPAQGKTTAGGSGGVFPAALRLLDERAALLLAVLFVTALGLGLWHVRALHARLAFGSARHGADLHAQTLEELRTLYTSEVVERVRGHGVQVTHDYAGRPGAIPLPATLSLELGRRVGERGSGLQVRLYSDHPFPWRKDGGPRDAFEREALARLRERPHEPVTRIEDYRGQPSLRLAVADLMRPACLACHNSHPASPKKDWKEGEVRGVLEVIRPLAPVVAETRKSLAGTVALLGGLAGLGFLALLLILTKLRRAGLHLEEEVARRTAALADANQELEAFSYSVSHDLRAPLRAIAGFAGMLVEDATPGLDAEGRRRLEVIRSSARQMDRLIADLLEFSQASRRPLRQVPIDMTALAGEAQAELAAAHPGRRIVWRLAPLPAAQGDPALFRMVWQNLLSNAVKFTRPREEASIEIGGGIEDGARVYWVTDNGVGFDMRYAGKLFGVFQRLHEADQFEGTGVGLALVQRIVRRHGGVVSAQGEPGAGARFEFRLPAGEDGR